MVFENINQAKECLIEWQKRLYLDDWLIKIEFGDCDEDALAHINTNHDMKTAKITFSKNVEKWQREETFYKYFAEKILVHELLHIIFDMPYFKETVECSDFKLQQHQKVEFMARSLIMTKYNLNKSWFLYEP